MLFMDTNVPQKSTLSELSKTVVYIFHLDLTKLVGWVSWNLLDAVPYHCSGTCPTHNVPLHVGRKPSSNRQAPAVFRIFHKLALTLKTFIAPELIAVEGAQEWTQARRLVKEIVPAATNDEFQAHTCFLCWHAWDTISNARTAAEFLWPNQFAWLLEARSIQMGKIIRNGT